MPLLCALGSLSAGCRCCVRLCHCRVLLVCVLGSLRAGAAGCRCRALGSWGAGAAAGCRCLLGRLGAASLGAGAAAGCRWCVHLGACATAGCCCCVRVPLLSVRLGAWVLAAAQCHCCVHLGAWVLALGLQLPCVLGKLRNRTHGVEKRPPLKPTCCPTEDTLQRLRSSKRPSLAFAQYSQTLLIRCDLSWTLSLLWLKTAIHCYVMI